MYKSWGQSSAPSPPPRGVELGGVACHPQRPCMFDQSPPWGLGTAFPSNPQTIAPPCQTGLGGFEGRGRPPKCAKDPPVLGQDRQMWGRVGSGGRKRQRKGSRLSLLPSLCLLPPLCLRVSPPISVFLLEAALCQRHGTSSRQPPIPFFDEAPLPSAARAEGKEPWKEGAGGKASRGRLGRD